MLSTNVRALFLIMIAIISLKLVTSLYFTYFPNFEERFYKDWSTDNRRDDKVDESVITSFQQDVRMCRNWLFMEKVSEVDFKEKSVLKLESQHRITALKFVIPNYPKYPVFSKFPTHVNIQYRLDIFEDFEDVVENGELKTFVGDENLEEENGGVGTIVLEPSIIAKEIRVIFKHYVFLTEKPSIILLGCKDEEGIKNFQFNSKSMELSFAEALPYDSQLLQPDFEEGCPVFNFEDGALVNWTIEGKAFKHQPTYDDNKYYRERQSATGFLGRWWVSSYEYHPTPTSERTVTNLSYTGTLQSPLFFINTTKLSFLIGGGDDTGKIGVQIIVFRRVVKSLFLKKEIKVMERHAFDMSRYRSKPATLVLVDKSTKGSLMFDDLRTVERCNDECMKPLGMESGEITDSMITASNTVREPNNAPHHARLTTSFDDSNVFISPMKKFPWLQIRLPVEAIIDGWATQGALLAENKWCSLSTYFVKYGSHESIWRYISIRNYYGTPAKCIFEHKLGEITRQWLNPRLVAKLLRFIFYQTNSQINQFCFRVELYGCPRSKMIDGSMKVATNFESLLERRERMKDDYLLKVLHLPKKFVEVDKRVKLSCDVHSNVLLNNLPTSFEWYEIIFNSKLTLAFNTRHIWLPLEKSFVKRIIGCHQFLSLKLFFTAEFILTEKTSNIITPFVTAEPGLEYRGGRLIHANPAPIYNDGSNSFFFSLHLANAVHPYVTMLKNRDHCPPANVMHYPFRAYSYLGLDDNELSCFNKVVAAGHRSFAYEFHKKQCYGGEGTNSWTKPKQGDTLYQKNFNLYGCVILFSKYQKEMGSPCLKTCQRRLLELSSDRFRTFFFYVMYKPKVKYLTITVEINEYTIHTQRFDESHLNKLLYERTNYERKYPSREDLMRVKFTSDTYFGARDMNCFYRTASKGEGKDCMFYVSAYSSVPWGAGNFVTLLYSFHDANIYEYPQVKISGEYTMSDGSSKGAFTQYIDVRNKAEPRIMLDKEIGVCMGEYKEIAPVVHIDSVVFNAYKLITFHWKYITRAWLFEEELKKGIPTVVDTEKKYYQNKGKLIFVEALPIHTGWYELTVFSPFGISKNTTYINVYKDFPNITWITSSPHVVVEEKSDILEIRTNTDKHIKDIRWYKDGIFIKQSTQFVFLDDTGEAYERKRLLLKNLNHKQLSGKYKVELIGEYCSFHSTIDVTVHVKPFVSIKSNLGGGRNLVGEKGKKIVLTAKISGGYPPVTESDLHWTKDGGKIANIAKGRISIENSQQTEDGWLSKLEIKDLNFKDAAEYQFIVGTSVSRKKLVSVIKKVVDLTTEKPTVLSTTLRLQTKWWKVFLVVFALCNLVIW